MYKKICLLFFALAFIACEDTPPVWPDLAGLKWQAFAPAQAPFSLQYPYGFELNQQGASALINYQGGLAFRIDWLTEAEVKNRGLWLVVPPSGTQTIGKHSFTKYDYSHYDGPFGTNFLAYVTQVGDKWLGVQFRTTADALTPAQEAVLRSLEVR